MRVLLCFYFCLIITVYTIEENFWDKLNLEPSLLPWHVSSDKFLRKKCLQDLSGCPEEELKKERCFGFEKTCDFNENSYSFNKTKCSKNTSGFELKKIFIDKKPKMYKKFRHRTPEQQKKKFWEQGDFGYAIPRIQNMKIICSSKNKEGSILECSDNLRMCKAKNIFFNFKSFDAKKSKRYRNDILKEGEVGGNCDEGFDKKTLHSRLEEKSYLQSWGHEFEYFETYPDFIINNENCDIIFEKPTIVIKLDASINLYHHFCDFVNLYLTQFINGSFSQDVDVLWWDTFSGGFVDSYFGDAWKAFTFNKPKELIHLQNKKVCFRNALFPLLARQRLGIYYNMPLIDGCQGSGLFHAFTRHFLYRLNIPQNGPIKDKLRITILQRDSIARKIINIEELLNATNSLKNVEAKVVVYDKKIKFLDQLKITHNSDIFIGMHGAGLTHLLFLPDWAAVFELYNCDDVHCYYDLSRLRGVKYWTWKRDELVIPEKEGIHPTLGTPHKKFTNYSFDVIEFIRIVKQMIEYVRRHPQFVEEQRKLRRQIKAEL